MHTLDIRALSEAEIDAVNGGTTPKEVLVKALVLAELIAINNNHSIEYQIRRFWEQKVQNFVKTF